MVFESWVGASTRAKALSVSYFICQFLVWCACCVGFGAELFDAKSADLRDATGDSPSYRFYFDRVESDTGHYNFADLNPLNGRNSCTSAGRALVAFSAIAFICISITMILTISRIASLPFQSLPHPRHSLLLELLLSIIAIITYFLGMVIYAGMCYRSFQDNSHWYNVTATGYGFILAAFFIQLISLGLCIAIRRDETCWMGIGGDGGFGTGAGVSILRDGGGTTADGLYADNISGFNTMKDEGDITTPTTAQPIPVAAKKSASNSRSKAASQPIYQTYQNSDT